MYRREYDLFIKHCNLVLCIAEAHSTSIKQVLASASQGRERGERPESKRSEPQQIKILSAASSVQPSSQDKSSNQGTTPLLSTAAFPPLSAHQQTVDIVMSIDEEKAQRLYGDLHRLPSGYFNVGRIDLFGSHLLDPRNASVEAAKAHPSLFTQIVTCVR